MDCGWCSHWTDVPSSCQECPEARMLCNKCVDRHLIDKPKHRIVKMDLQSDTDLDEIVDEKAYRCKLHPSKELKFFCGKCEHALCQVCAETYEHSSHVVVLLQNAVYNYQSAIDQTISALKRKINELELEKKEIERMTKSLNNRADESARLINDCFAKLVNILELRRNELLNQLCCEVDQTRKELLSRQNTINTQIERMLEVCPEPSELNKSVPELQSINKQLKQLLDTDKPKKTRAPADEDWPSEFAPTSLANVEVLVKRLGTIASNNQLNVEVTAQGDGLRYCRVHKETIITLNTRSTKGSLVAVAVDLFEVALVDKFGETVGSCSLEPTNTEGKYELRYQLEEEGIYHLAVKVHNRQMHGSPFQIHSLNERQYSMEQCTLHSKFKYGRHQDDLIRRIGNQGKQKHQFTNPQGIACSSEKIIAADSQHQEVKVFNLKGEYQSHINIRGREPGALRRPTGIAIDNDGYVFVADYDNKWVNLFDNSLRFIKRFGGARLLGPKGVAVDGRGNIVVVDNKASAVLIFNYDGKMLRKFGSRGNKPHQLAGPHYVAINEDNSLFVTDFHNHSVKVYDISGEFLFAFGQNGEANGEFNGPTGIAIDKDGNILVGDWGNNRIQIFDRQGIYLCQINCEAEPIFGPQGLAMTLEGHVAVADTGNHCIKIYRYLL